MHPSVIRCAVKRICQPLRLAALSKTITAHANTQHAHQRVPHHTQGTNTEIAPNRQHIRTHMHTHTDIHADQQAHTPKPMQTRTHTHMHLCTRTHTHTHNTHTFLALFIHLHIDPSSHA